MNNTIDKTDKFYDIFFEMRYLDCRSNDTMKTMEKL